MSLTYTKFTLSAAYQQKVEELADGDGWNLLPASALDGILPAAYLSKVDSVVKVSVPTSSGGTCVMFNNLRVDARTRLIDQDPFAFFKNSTGVTQHGVLLHHGSWAERSWNPSTCLWRHVNENGIGGYFIDNPPGNRCSTSTDDLPRGHVGALAASLKVLRSV